MDALCVFPTKGSCAVQPFFLACCRRQHQRPFHTQHRNKRLFVADDDDAVLTTVQAHAAGGRQCQPVRCAGGVTGHTAYGDSTALWAVLLLQSAGPCQHTLRAGSSQLWPLQELPSSSR